jgi:hypothetical protein
MIHHHVLFTSHVELIKRILIRCKEIELNPSFDNIITRIYFTRVMQTFSRSLNLYRGTIPPWN